MLTHTPGARQVLSSPSQNCPAVTNGGPAPVPTKNRKVERFYLALVAAPDHDGIPAIVRLRRLLKYAGRVCLLRCKEIRPDSASIMSVETAKAENENCDPHIT
jgi:hypothetical protein